MTRTSLVPRRFLNGTGVFDKRHQNKTVFVCSVLFKTVDDYPGSNNNNDDYDGSYDSGCNNNEEVVDDDNDNSNNGCSIDNNNNNNNGCNIDNNNNNDIDDIYCDYDNDDTRFAFDRRDRNLRREKRPKMIETTSRGEC